VKRTRRWWCWRGVQIVAVAGGVVIVGAALRPSHASTPVTYELAWDLGDATVHADGSWTVVTDDGAEVTVTGGSLATCSATLLECPHGHSWLDGLTGVFGIATASAGHTSGGPDAAATQGPIAQSLVDLSPVTLGDAVLAEPDYCEAHTAVAGGGASVDATTLSITGTWRAAGDDTAVAFAIETDQAWGAVVAADLPGTTRTVELVRPLDTLFDDVDIVTQTPEEQAEAILRSLTEQTTTRAT